jgi:KEOPS complex subunit Cgi121
MEALDKYKDVQLIDPSCIAGEGHLKSAISHAERAFKRKENISTNPFIEVVVRAAQSRQIKNAFELLGPKGSKEVIAISEEYPKQLIEEYGCSEDKNILGIDEKKYEKIKEVFDIDEKEIMAVSSKEFEERVLTLQKIIAERIALLNKI